MTSDERLVEVRLRAEAFHHLALSDHHAALIFPLAMFFACLALKLLRFSVMAFDSPALGLPAVLAPCSPKRMTFSVPPSHALTMWDFLGWSGVRFGALQAISDFLAGFVAMVKPKPAQGAQGSQRKASAPLAFRLWC